jgi:replicative DNA helicase
MMGLNEHLDSLLKMQKVWEERKSPVFGISTGYPSIDQVTGGLQNGEVTILAARTSHGKTALATKIAFNIAENIMYEDIETNDRTGRVLIFSPEMTPEQLLLRQACTMAEVPSQLIRTGLATPLEVEAFKEAVRTLRNLDPIVYLKATGSVDVGDLVMQVENMNSNGPPVKLVVVDYLQRLTAGGRNGAYDKASHISFAIKDLANRQKVPVLLCSQLNRSPEKRKDKDDPEAQYPELSDLRDSGRIEEDADAVWLLWRPNKLTTEHTEASDMQQGLIRIAKNRHGPVAAIPIRFYPHLTLFKDAGLDRVEYDGGSSA